MLGIGISYLLAVVAVIGFVTFIFVKLNELKLANMELVKNLAKLTLKNEGLAAECGVKDKVNTSLTEENQCLVKGHLEEVEMVCHPYSLILL
jgi:hypothetical protein